MKRAAVVILVLSIVMLIPGKAVAAAEQCGWAEDIGRARKMYQEVKLARAAGTLSSGSWKDWTQIGSNEVETAKMYHKLTTYELWSQTQDVRWGKVIGVREAKPNNSTYGYVSIRFENLFGEELEGTYSGHIWNYGTSEAKTPRPSGGAYLRAYCGD